jgi:hypothetical protein
MTTMISNLVGRKEPASEVEVHEKQTTHEKWKCKECHDTTGKKLPSTVLTDTGEGRELKEPR